MLTDEPLQVSEKRYEQLRKIANVVDGYIREYDLTGQAKKLGLDPVYVNDAMAVDGVADLGMVYGGLDVYFDNDEPKVLEINARPQAMGFQDVRMEAMGIVDQPMMIDDFIEWLDQKGLNKVHILGSRKNPF